MEITKINSHWPAFLFTQRSKISLIKSGLSLFLIIASLSLVGAESSFTEGITVDLRSPEFSEGILKTDCGGVISAEGIRIQGRKIIYTRKVIEDRTVCTIEAEGDILIEYGDYLFIGRRLEYDFQTKTGIIYNGKTAIEPWFFGGERIHLLPDGTYIIYDSFLTTAENCDPEWKLTADRTTLYPDHDLQACNFKFKYYDVPLIWAPSLKINLDSVLDFPINYSARWGGRQGPRVEFIYEIFSWKRWKTFLRFDYRLTRGPGLGFESYYKSEDHREYFEAINYIARDSSLDNPGERTRYRLQGNYANSLFDDKVTLSLTYDKLSDKDMATDYSDSGLNLEYPGATELLMRRQSDNWIANLKTSVRLNNFQTIKQELPTLEITWKPSNLGQTYFVSNQFFKISYLDFLYAKHIHQYDGDNIDKNDVKNPYKQDVEDTLKHNFKRTHKHDFASSRIQYSKQIYRSYRISSLVLTPEIGGTAIYYGNLPSHDKTRLTELYGKNFCDIHFPKKNRNWLLMGIFKLDAKLPFYKEFPFCTHTITPYACYEWYTIPTSRPHEHHIFDIEDGLYGLQMVRFGLQQTMYNKNSRNLLYRPVQLDLYANAFIDSKTYSTPIPKIYGLLNFYSTPWIKHTLDTAWDFEHGMLDHFNIRTACTFGPNAAFTAEFRHRDAYDFRKADHTNFMIDAFLKPSILRKTPMSDRRDTVLFNLFYRFHPLWALDLQTRHGWNRKDQPNYTEFEIDLIGKPHAAWHVKFSYQHCENDRHRFTVYFNMGTLLPDSWKCDHFIPLAEF